MLAFRAMERPDTRLVWPAVLLRLPPSVMSLVLPPDCSSRLPAALMSPLPANVVKLPAAVSRINWPALLRSSWALSVCTDGLGPAFVTVPSSKTRLTVSVALCPTVIPLDSAR